MKNYLHLLVFTLTIYGSSQTLDCSNKSQMNRKEIKQTDKPATYDCLPKEIKPETVVSVTRKQTAAGADQVVRETVKERLDRLNARCEAGKLVGEDKKEIRFYKLQDCWGNPPSDYREILDRQQGELEELKKKYTVIEITCNPSGDMPF